MGNYNALRELLRRTSGQDNVITVPRVYVRYTGDLTTAILLNQIVFYSDKSKRTDGFFYKSYDDWEREICLSKRQVRYSTDKLKALGIVETKIKKANGAPTVHYKLDYDKLVDSIVTNCYFTLEQNVTNEDDKMSLSLTENTTENTTERKDSHRKRVYDTSSAEFKIAEFFYHEILKNNPTHKKPDLQKWANDIRLLLEIDNRDKSEVSRLIRWVQRDSFEMANVLSPAKLRKRYDGLIMKMNKPAEGSKDKQAPKSREIKEFELDPTRGE